MQPEKAVIVGSGGPRSASFEFLIGARYPDGLTHRLFGMEQGGLAPSACGEADVDGRDFPIAFFNGIHTTERARMYHESKQTWSFVGRVCPNTGVTGVQQKLGS